MVPSKVRTRACLENFGIVAVIVGISRDPVRLMGARQAAIWWVHSAPLALEIKRQCEAEETSDVVSVAAGSCG